MQFKEYSYSVLKRFEYGVKNLEDIVKLNSVSSQVYPLIKESLIGGKKLRAILGVLSYQAAGGDADKAVSLAIAIELAHNASLIHDDIVDNDETRRGKVALHKRIGVGKAVVLGDAMILLSVNIASTHKIGVVRLLSKYGFYVCDGEFIDTSANFNKIEDITEEDYFLKIYKKSAALFKASAYVAAYAAGGSQKEIDALSAFGENVGIIYQVKDDINDLMKIKNGIYSSDLKNGVMTLPLIHFYKNADSNKRKLLVEIFGKEHSIADSKELLDELVNCGSIKYCEEQIRKNETDAKVCLDDLSDNEFKKLLFEYLDYILGL